MPVLHQMRVSGDCYKVRLAARQLNIELTLKDYGLHDGTTRKPEFLSKNPNGRVPLLELEDGRTLAESDAILWFLSEDTFLLPADRWGRAEVLQWMFFEQYSHEPYVAVARFWLSFALKEELEKRRHLIPEWHVEKRPAARAAFLDSRAAISSVNAATNRVTQIGIRPPKSPEFGSRLAVGKSGTTLSTGIDLEKKWRRGWDYSALRASPLRGRPSGRYPRFVAAAVD